MTFAAGGASVRSPGNPVWSTIPGGCLNPRNLFDAARVSAPPARATDNRSRYEEARLRFCSARTGSVFSGSTRERFSLANANFLELFPPLSVKSSNRSAQTTKEA